ncbi:hypothetical protein [Rufibacter latericius]|uniref:Uncharacterized protein n=1 Tax=Rufibacter latericius TaxID=2487040 RepID=A0A3M9MUK0_9BACT|nr:hypothetical protein [Rufibacter latericius]RNI29201.1 hypothetical protein EFB08_07200 [Rufibacter latericius]
MNRDNRDWNDYGQHQNRHQNYQPHQNERPGRDMSHDNQHLHRYAHHQQNPYGQHQYDHHQERSYGNSTQYRTDRNGHHPYQSNYSHDQDRFGQTYQDDFRNDPTLPRGGEDDDLMGNIRQGYGISSFDGISDRFNTLNSEQRYGSHQDEQAYYSGDRDGYNRSQFGGGLGESGLHSDRGIPNYGIRSYSERYGSGMGSSYGGTNYGGGQGYTGGHQGGTWGNNSYGTNSGNLTGYGPGGESTYGGGMGSTGDTSSSQNSSRGRNELGGF